MAGLMQLTPGVFRLGAIINFLSHPVIVGFTNAAAIIIALPQVKKGIRMFFAQRRLGRLESERLWVTA